MKILRNQNMPVAVNNRDGHYEFSGHPCDRRNMFSLRHQKYITSYYLVIKNSFYF